MSDLRFRLPDGVFELRAAAIVIRRSSQDPSDDAVLMAVDAAHGNCYSVGGAVLFGETMREACARETREETGTGLVIGALAAVEEAIFEEDGQCWHVVTCHFWVDGQAESLKGVEGFDNGEVSLHWFDAAELDSVTFYPRFYREALMKPWSGVRHFTERDGVVTEDTAVTDAS